MSKQILVFKKYSRKGGKIIGGRSFFFERNKALSEKPICYKIIDRIHNYEEYFIRRLTKRKCYKRYFEKPYFKFLTEYNG